MPGLATIEPYCLPTAGELPDNIAGWDLDPGRAVLLIHDMQRYFMRPFPGVVAEPLVANCSRLVEFARGHGMQVCYSAQPGGMDSEQRGLLKDFWGPGMRVDPADRQLVEPLAEQPGDWMLTKWRYSAFVHSDLLQRMRWAGRNQLVVCGVYAHVGVLMTAVEAFSNDIETFLVADAVADFSADHHRMAVSYAAQRCAVVKTTKEMTA
ncbi:isochorismate hydrolase [Kibdelosporangium banguiense]|uniref:Isochorismate hydrolase n=1 Tax=Kibdelosporangium banguiense TaxID=1365924 RepID=A0ABS4TM49_9PSEU|nr:isochorismatase family protein [Kibdelosporangium banguiense]MBP2324998.1 isochorismate hydrolase [Kibdelosporangium banguiense]